MFSKRLDNLHPYVPGEQPKDRDYIKLNANENPYPPSPRVKDAIDSYVCTHVEKLGLYPDPASEKLRESIAEMLNHSGGVLSNAFKNGDGDYSLISYIDDNIPFRVSKDMIFCGNGSDEVLSLVYYTFFNSGETVIVPRYTYSFYPVYAGYYGVPLDSVSLKEDWSLDTAQMTADAIKYNAPTIFANPNAPTGIGLSREGVRQMLEKCPKDKVFIVDEAYVDFGGQSCIPLLKEFPNLVIVRTFSKSMSLAGLRLGYVVANPDVIRALFTVKNSFNHFPVDVLAQIAGETSCRDCAYYAKNAKKIVAERESFSTFLRERGFFVIPSSTNFVFAKKDGKRGEDLYKAIKEKGILVRHFATAGIEDFLRITIGTEEQMNALKAAMQNM